MQMLRSFTSLTVVVSRGPSAAAAGRTRPAAPAIERVVRKRRRVCVIGIGTLPLSGRSCPQLAFELVQKAPIRAVDDYLMRGSPWSCLLHGGATRRTGPCPRDRTRAIYRKAARCG